jgi:hypothetical protein
MPVKQNKQTNKKVWKNTMQKNKTEE